MRYRIVDGQVLDTESGRVVPWCIAADQWPLETCFAQYISQHEAPRVVSIHLGPDGPVCRWGAPRL